MEAKKSGIIYKGDYQIGETIGQKLQGPIGEGSVKYPNGDSFEGFFHLNYAHIFGPAYAADGKFCFADGSVIEHAWIDTSSDLEIMNLHGLFRVKHPGGPDTLTPFEYHKKSGLELVFADEPYAIEWSLGEKIQELEIDAYNLEEIDKDRCKLEILLKDGTRVVQFGGDQEDNGYGQFVFKTQLCGQIEYPDGESLTYYGYNLRGLKPWCYSVIRHLPSGKCRSEEWKEGVLVNAGEEKWDNGSAKEASIPNPFAADDNILAYVWNGHIQYFRDGWVYDGQMKDGLPDGKGVLVSESDGRRYEGSFREGRANGLGKLTNDKGGYVQDGLWVDGAFQESAPLTEKVVLKMHIHDDHWSAGGGSESSEDLEEEAKLGSFPQTGFWDLRIDRMESKFITFFFKGETKVLTKGATIYFSNEVEGREYSDGCVYDGDDYSIAITWPE